MPQLHVPTGFSDAVGECPGCGVHWPQVRGRRMPCPFMLSQGLGECCHHPCLLTLAKERENAMSICGPAPAREWDIAVTACVLLPQQGSGTVLRLIALPLASEVVGGCCV